jgi:hypothetical protein
MYSSLWIFFALDFEFTIIISGLSCYIGGNLIFFILYLNSSLVIFDSKNGWYPFLSMNIIMAHDHISTALVYV